MVALTPRALRVYAHSVTEPSVIGGSSPEFRRRNRAIINAVFSCASHGGSYGMAVRGEPQGSPVPEPGLLTRVQSPTFTFSSVVVGSQTQFRSQS
jgi:hypothetical protein